MRVMVQSKISRLLVSKLTFLMFVHMIHATTSRSSRISTPTSTGLRRRRRTFQAISSFPSSSSSYNYFPKSTTRAAFTTNAFLPSSQFLIQCASGIATYTGLVAYFDRPRGKLLIDPSYLETRNSNVEGGGLGLFVTKSLPEGTILGTYPGVLRPAHKYKQKYDRVSECSTYTWRFTDNQYFIDPTDVNGMLGDFCQGGTDDFPFSYVIHKCIGWNIPTLLARINEPPIGAGGCNVRSEEDLKTREVVFSLSTSVVAGQELFMDYGLTYDRSMYGKGSM